MRTNIKNLPAGPTYWTENALSQPYPWGEEKTLPSGKTVTLTKVYATWVEVKRSSSGRAITIAKVNIVADPEWDGETFDKQTWLYAGVDEKTTERIFKNKDGVYRWRSELVFHENCAVELHVDY